nr:hypothetical protein [Mesorhizobium amorphae]
MAENAVKFANLDSQAETVRNDLEFQQAVIDATGLQRTIRYFSELTADVRRFNHQLGVVYTDRKGDAEKYVVKLFESLRDGDLRTAHEIWQAKFSKALERYLSLIADSESDGGEPQQRWSEGQSALRSIVRHEASSRVDRPMGALPAVPNASSMPQTVARLKLQNRFGQTSDINRPHEDRATDIVCICRLGRTALPAGRDTKCLEFRSGKTQACHESGWQMERPPERPLGVDANNLAAAIEGAPHIARAINRKAVRHSIIVGKGEEHPATRYRTVIVKVVGKDPMTDGVAEIKLAIVWRESRAIANDEAFVADLPVGAWDHAIEERVWIPLRHIVGSHPIASGSVDLPVIVDEVPFCLLGVREKARFPGICVEEVEPVIYGEKQAFVGKDERPNRLSEIHLPAVDNAIALPLPMDDGAVEVDPIERLFCRMPQDALTQPIARWSTDLPLCVVQRHGAQLPM